MAVKQLMLRKQIKDKKIELEVLRAKDADFFTRKIDLTTREEALAVAIDEAKTDVEKIVVETEGAELLEIEAAITTEQAEHEAAKAKLTDEIAELERQLSEVEKNEPKPAPAAQAATGEKERTAENNMITRTRYFGGMTADQMRSLTERSEVKDFLTRVRGLKGQNRAVTGAELEIPDAMLGVLYDNLYRYSKLIAQVNLKRVGGKARQTIAGAIPEAIWTESYGKLNELALKYMQVEVDGYKIGGFIPVPNALLEDTDINLASDILNGIGQGMGIGIDKAILYGNRTKMPLGIATRLAQTSKPSDWPVDGPAWANLSTSHIVKLDSTGKTPEAFFADLVLKMGLAAPNYATGGTFWAMNRETRMKLMSLTINFNAAGALVAAQNGVMPIEGGSIVELPFIPTGDIIGGFGSLYLLAERAGAQLAVSEHVRFIEDQTVFRGTSRYDGMPVLGEAFMLLNINNGAATTTATFPPDTANEEEEEG